MFEANEGKRLRKSVGSLARGNVCVRVWETKRGETFASACVKGETFAYECLKLTRRNVCGRVRENNEEKCLH